MSPSFELRIDSIAAGGDGVGRHDGVVVFVPRTAPGDLVRVSAELHDRLMRGKMIELLEPSPIRGEPPCAHYVGDGCGGCQLQHLLYEGQLDAKAAIIRDSLARIGRVTVEKPPVEPSGRQWRYRKKLTLALRRDEAGWIMGLHRFDDPAAVFDLRDCPITQERVIWSWLLVRQREHLLPNVDEMRAAVRLLESGFAFTIEGGASWTVEAHTELFDTIASMAELWWKPAGKSRRLLHSRAVSEEAGASFTQVNPGVAAKLREWVVSLASASQPKTAIDAYAGTGEIALALAGQGTSVIAIEIDRDAARVAASRLPDGSRAIAAPVEKALQKALPADLVVLNPPRAGIHERVAQILEAQHPRPNAILYVSCNPATLARDVRRMESYRVRSLRGFDMFPQTAHVETVCELVPAA